MTALLKMTEYFINIQICLLMMSFEALALEKVNI